MLVIIVQTLHYIWRYLANTWGGGLEERNLCMSMVSKTFWYNLLEKIRHLSFPGLSTLGADIMINWTLTNWTMSQNRVDGNKIFRPTRDLGFKVLSQKSMICMRLLQQISPLSSIHSRSSYRSKGLELQL